MKRPFAVTGLTLFFTIAFLYEHETGVAAAALAFFAVALVISLLIRHIRNHGFLPVFFASGALSCVLIICATNFTYLPVMVYDGVKNCEVKARITSLPEFNYGNCYYETDVFSLNGEEADFKLRMTFSSQPEAEPYDVIEGNFNLYALGASDDDLLQSYKSQGMFLGGYPVNEAYDVISVPENEKPFSKKILDLREGIKDSVYRLLPNEKGELAVSLLTGDKSSLPDDIYSDFKVIGISHIICVSGFHLSLWSMLVLKIFRKMKLNRILADVCAGLSVILFMSIAGFTYSVVRAGIMMLVFLLGDMIMKRRDSLNSLGFALTVSVLINPLSVGAVSLKLSALATLGIILYNQYIAPDFSKVIDKINYEPLKKAVSYVCTSLMITVSATAFTLPVSLPLYGTVNFLTFFCNLIVVPLAGAGMVMSSVCAFIGNAVSAVGGYVAYPVSKLLGFIIAFADRFAQIKSAVFYVDNDNMILLFTGVFVIAVTTVFISRFRKRIYTLACFLCIAFFTVGVIAISYTSDKETKVTVVDCDGGVSVLMSCNGENMLIGCSGEDFFGARKIIDTVYSNGNSLDTFVVPDLSSEEDSYVYDVLFAYKPRVACFDGLPQGAELLLSDTEKKTFSGLSDSENIRAESCTVSGNDCVLAKTDDVSVLICFGSVFDYSALPSDFKNTDIIISYGNFPRGVHESPDSKMILISQGERSRYIRQSLDEKGIPCISTGNGEGTLILRCDGGMISTTWE